MAETINEGKWHWYDVMSDLEKQGFSGVTIDPSSVDTHGCGGITERGTKFFITWASNIFLLVSVSQEEQALIDAFTMVVEYQPFCRYIDDSGLLTFEWDKKDPDGRFADLQKVEKQELRML